MHTPYLPPVVAPGSHLVPGKEVKKSKMLFRLSLTVDVGELDRAPLTVGTYVEMLFGSHGVPQARGYHRIYIIYWDIA